jgi:hypothetical protein
MNLKSDRNFLEIKENDEELGEERKDNEWYENNEGLVNVRIGNEWYENYEPYYAIAFIISNLERMLEDILGNELIFLDDIPDPLDYLENNNDVFELTGINPRIFKQFPNYQSSLI